MTRDAYVNFRREEDIASRASALRSLSKCDVTKSFDVVDAVCRFTGKKFGENDVFRLEIFDGLRPLGFAYVTFQPLVMHIEAETWEHASMGDPYSRHVIAHEIGHAVLHDKNAKMFSRHESRYNTYGMEEYSSEWQAEVFASHLLIPDEMALMFDSVELLALHAGSPQKYALERLGAVRRRKKAPSSSAHGTESCITCGNFSVSTNGLIKRCDFCGLLILL